MKGKRMVALSIFILLIAFFAVIIQESKIKDVKLVYLIAKSGESNFWKTVYSGAETAAREYNLELVIKYPQSEDDFAQQNKYIEEAIDKKADAIVFSASNYNGSVEYAEKAIGLGIKFIVIDSDINTKKKHAFIGTDNLEAGYKAGEDILALVGENPKIGIISCEEGSGVGIQRTKGFYDCIKTVGKTSIISTLYAQSNIQSPYSMTKQMMENNPDINAIFTVNEWTTLGVARAIDELNLYDKVVVVGFDNNMESIKMLEKGVIKSLVVQNAFAMGYLGVEAAIEYANNKHQEYKNINTGTVIIDNANMYNIENQKLIFPFSFQN